MFSQRDYAFKHSIGLAVNAIEKNSIQFNDITLTNVADEFNHKQWSNDVLVKLIKFIQQDEDIASNIYSKFHFPKENDQYSIFFRDARQLKLETRRNLYHPYAVMGLQAMLAARKLAEIAGITDINQRFRLEDAEDFYQRISQNVETDCHEYDLALFIEQVILPEVADALKITTNEAAARLQVAKDFANFEFLPFAVATLTEHQDSQNKATYVLHVDAPIFELTPELKEEYLQRQQRNWYQLLNVWQQQLIDHYVNAIIEGRVIPTQLRKYLPGLRNAAEEKIFAIRNDKAVDIYHTYHSGNLGHFTKGDNDLLTGLVLDQLIAEVQPAHLHLAALTSPIGKNDEADLNEQVDLAVRARCNQVSSALVPVNTLRHMMKAKFETSWMIQAVEKILKAAANPKIILKSLSSDAFWKQDLNVMLSDKFKDSFYFKELINVTRSLIDAKKGTDFNADKRSDGNRHLEVACNEILLAFYYEQCCLELKNPLFKPFAVDVFCKSGKDRTGLLDLIAIIYAVTKYCARKTNDANLYQQIFDSVTNVITQARHIQRRAGELGATMGAEGFVASLEFALPKRFFEDKALRDWILLRPAKFNKKYPSLQHYQPSDDQQKRQSVICQQALSDLQLSTNKPSVDAAVVGLELAKKAQKALDQGQVGEIEAPILTDFLKSTTRLVAQKDPASAEYQAEYRRYHRATTKVVGNKRLGYILGGTALFLLGVASLAIAIALAVPTGGLSLPVGFIISAQLMAGGLGFLGAALMVGGVFLGIEGRKRGVAKYADATIKNNALTPVLAF